MKVVRCFVLLSCLAGVLQACGGGSAGSESSPSSGNPQPPSTPPVPGGSTWTVRLNWQSSDEPRLAGYRVYHGLSSAAKDELFEAGLSTSFTYTTSASGTHYFALAAIDLTGVESPRSAPIQVDLK